MTTLDFQHTHLPALGKTVLRLGLAPNYGLDAAGIRAALDDRGMQYVFWSPVMFKATAPLREALATDRERYVVATGPNMGFWGGNMRSFVERALRALRTDYLDVLQLNWLGVASWWTDGTVQAMQAMREEGKVRSLGVSIHNRTRAGELAAESPLDQFMIRYNAAHPGAERDIFPKNPAGPGRKAVVAYTATAWRKLLKRPRGWTEAVPAATDCYRFCLSNPAVDVVLTGPKDMAQLDENLHALQRGAMSGEEEVWMRRFGQTVHG